ncbi:MAG: GNAT family N-acetyltransferase [Chloroflexi bacterium]|nr:GNAT family N-acetyltransferase [Chloroflexota bacterium]
MPPSQNFDIRALTRIEQMQQVVGLQQAVWPGIQSVPEHLLLTAAHSGGLVLGAWEGETLIGFVFGFLGLHGTGASAILKHCSDMLGVLPEYRDRGLGAALKRAQWQMVRKQGIELITWTYDPLESRNANLNVAKLGAIAKTYLPDLYGEMSDGLNAGLPSDRFMVEWWVNSPRVAKRLSRQPRRRLDLAHFLSAEAAPLNATALDEDGWPRPASDELHRLADAFARPPLTLFEIPSEFRALKSANQDLALEWRLYARTAFDLFFSHGYLVTDFVHLPGSASRSYYVLSHGESTLGR